MIQKLRRTVVSVRALLATAGPFLLLTLGLLWLAYWLVEPQPPKSLVMVTGPANSDYDRFGLRYQAMLAKHNIRLELRQSAGSRENLELLLKPDGDVDVAIIREGTGTAEELADRPLSAIASLFYEPIWLFHRDSVKIKSLADMRGLNINVGPPGAGTARLIDELLAQNQLRLSVMNVQRLDHTEAVIA